jgi:hypothetical protein
MQQVAPRHFTPSAGMPGIGLPGDRDTRIAARGAFVALKLSFLQSLCDASGADWLRAQVRSAEQPVDLWLLRAAVFDALAGTDSVHRGRRQALRRALDSMFPDLDADSSYTTL